MGFEFYPPLAGLLLDELEPLLLLPEEELLLPDEDGEYVLVLLDEDGVAGVGSMVCLSILPNLLPLRLLLLYCDEVVDIFKVPLVLPTATRVL